MPWISVQFNGLTRTPKLGEHTRPRGWLDAPRVQPLCARTFAQHPERFRAFEVFRAGAENRTRGAGAPHPTSEFGFNKNSRMKRENIRELPPFINAEIGPVVSFAKRGWLAANTKCGFLTIFHPGTLKARKLRSRNGQNAQRGWRKS